MNKFEILSVSDGVVKINNFGTEIILTYEEARSLISRLCFDERKISLDEAGVEFSKIPPESVPFAGVLEGEILNQNPYQNFVLCISYNYKPGNIKDEN